MAMPFPALSKHACGQGLMSRYVMALAISGAALLPLGCGGPKSISQLAGELKSSDAAVRRSAAKELEDRGPMAKAAIPALVETLRDSDREIRYRVTKALAKIGPDASAVSGLGVALKDADQEIRYYAAKSLSEIGPEAEPAVPALIEALADRTNEKARYYLIKSLRKIGPKAKSAAPALQEFVPSSDEKVRNEAAAALKAINK